MLLQPPTYTSLPPTATENPWSLSALPRKVFQRRTPVDPSSLATQASVLPARPEKARLGVPQVASLVPVAYTLPSASRQIPLPVSSPPTPSTPGPPRKVFQSRVPLASSLATYAACLSAYGLTGAVVPCQEAVLSPTTYRASEMGSRAMKRE